MDLLGISITGARKARRSRFEALATFATLTVSFSILTGAPGLCSIAGTTVVETENGDASASVGASADVGARDRDVHPESKIRENTEVSEGTTIPEGAAVAGETHAPATPSKSKSEVVKDSLTIEEPATGTDAAIQTRLLEKKSAVKVSNRDFTARIKELKARSASARKNAPRRFTESAPAGHRVALVLGGGGARGAAHIGVLRVLEENDMRPDMIVANSMGSVIGALYCAGVPLDEIEELCSEGKVKKAFLPTPIPIQMVKKALRPRIPFVKDEDRFPGVFSGEKLEKFINKTVGEEYQKIESLPIPLAITTVNLLDGKAYRFTKGNLGRMVRASCSLPPMLKPIRHEGMVLADGGIRANLPTYTARDIGADVVIAVNVDEKLKVVEDDEVQSFTGLANRVATIVLAVRDEQFSAEADLVIQPDVSGISIVSKADEDYFKAVEAGREAALDSLPALRKLFDLRTARREVAPVQ